MISLLLAPSSLRRKIAFFFALLCLASANELCLDPGASVGSDCIPMKAGDETVATFCVHAYPNQDQPLKASITPKTGYRLTQQYLWVGTDPTTLPTITGEGGVLRPDYDSFPDFPTTNGNGGGSGETVEWSLQFPGTDGYDGTFYCLAHCEVERVQGGASGDPHFQTWAGQMFDFHGACDLVLLHSLQLGGVDIHLRTQSRYQYSYIESVAVRVGEDVLQVGGWGEAILNGVDGPRFPRKFGGSNGNAPGSVAHTQETIKRHRFAITLEDQTKILIRTFKDLVSVSVDTSLSTDSALLLEESVGLMGSGTQGKMMARDGVTLLELDPDAFGQEWQVRSDEPKLFHVQDRAPQYPEPCTMPNSTATVRRRRLQDQEPSAGIDAFATSAEPYSLGSQFPYPLFQFQVSSVDCDNANPTTDRDGDGGGDNCGGCTHTTGGTPGDNGTTGGSSTGGSSGPDGGDDAVSPTAAPFAPDTDAPSSTPSESTDPPTEPPTCGNDGFGTIVSHRRHVNVACHPLIPIQYPSGTVMQWYGDGRDDQDRYTTADNIEADNTNKMLLTIVQDETGSNYLVGIVSNWLGRWMTTTAYIPPDQDLQEFTGHSFPQASSGVNAGQIPLLTQAYQKSQFIIGRFNEERRISISFGYTRYMAGLDFLEGDGTVHEIYSVNSGGRYGEYEEVCITIPATDRTAPLLPTPIPAHPTPPPGYSCPTLDGCQISVWLGVCAVCGPPLTARQYPQGTVLQWLRPTEEETEDAIEANNESAFLFTLVQDSSGGIYLVAILSSSRGFGVGCAAGVSFYDAIAGADEITGTGINPHGRFPDLRLEADWGGKDRLAAGPFAPGAHVCMRFPGSHGLLGGVHFLDGDGTLYPTGVGTPVCLVMPAA